MIRLTVHRATATPWRRSQPQALTAPYSDSGARRPSVPGSKIPASIVVTTASRSDLADGSRCFLAR